MTSLAPALLLSMPQLVDPNFTRAVVLLCKHSGEGAFGLVLNRPLLALDQRQQDQVVRNVLAELRRDDRHPAVIWVLASAAMAKLFDRVVVFDSGSLVEDGTHDELHAKGGTFKTLVSQ